MTKSFRLKALLASGALLVSAGGAAAATATAVATISVRADPSPRAELLDRLPAGESVNVIECDGDWCEISMGRDGTGFVLQDYLDLHGRAVRSTTVVIEDDEPGAIVGLSIGGYWEGRPWYVRDGYYYWGGRWYGARPGRPGWRTRSWRRWDDRRRDARIERRDDRRDARIERRDDRRDARIERRDDRRDARQERRDDRRDARPEGRDAAREQRIEQRQERIENRQEQRAESRDRGDRVGLDRAGGGGRGDGGGRGGDGGGRGGGGGRGDRN